MMSKNLNPNQIGVALIVVFIYILMDKWKMDKLRVYATGNNLMYLTADGYTGFNPESIDNTSPTTYGYQRAGSPVFSTISLGVNIDF